MTRSPERTAPTKQLPLTLTVSAARRRWGGRRVPFCAGRAAGRALILAVAQRAICVRGGRQGVPGDVPPVHMRALPAGLVLTLADPTHLTFLTRRVDTGRPRTRSCARPCTRSPLLVQSDRVGLSRTVSNRVPAVATESWLAYRAAALWLLARSGAPCSPDEGPLAEPRIRQDRLDRRASTESRRASHMFSVLAPGR
jgi:hypothetical protein